ncbi:hypothetical protein Agub_g8005 [Astrephomene gubernaculifera]|uniref:Uncharacterized protein n=1 Tax=Astrephomene gubernaculifera TaxID=47775 RepID=A0AAD3HMV8_9CHLO|nr:hypothetical protein Agub_g8005 [Astrephomene gubernaculifera]
MGLETRRSAPHQQLASRANSQSQALNGSNLLSLRRLALSTCSTRAASPARRATGAEGTDSSCASVTASCVYSDEETDVPLPSSEEVEGLTERIAALEAKVAHLNVRVEGWLGGALAATASSVAAATAGSVDSCDSPPSSARS